MTLRSILVPAILALSLLCPSQTPPRPSRQSPIDKKTIASHNGQYQLTAIPKHDRGYGPTSYVLKRGDEIVWRGEKPFLLRDLAVSDDGIVFGSSMTTGLYGMAPGNDHRLQIWRLDSQGKETELKSYERSSGATDVPLDPVADDPLLYEAADTALIPVYGLGDRFSMEDKSAFLLYKISDGAALGEWPFKEPKRDASNWVTSDLREIPGTRYTAVRTEDSKQNMWLSVVDLKGRELWRQQFHAAGKGAGINESVLSPEAPDFFPVSSPRHFASRIGDERVEFEVAEGDGLSVREVGRIPFRALYDDEKRNVPQIALTASKTVSLQSRMAASSAIHDLWGMISAGPNRFAYLERSNQRGGFLVMVDTSGKTLGRFDLSQLKNGPDGFYGDFTWLADKRFLATKPGGFPEEGVPLWIVDLETGKYKRVQLEGFVARTGLKLAGTPDGRIIAAGLVEKNGSSMNRVACFTSTGKPVWMLPEKIPGVDEFYGPEDLHVDAKGHILLLDNIANKLYRFSPKGALLNTIELKYSNGMQYASDLSPTPDGGFLIYDSGNSSKAGVPTMFRYSPAGKLLGSFRPHRSDGKSLPAYHMVRFDASGTMWCSDEHSLVKLDSKGKVVAEVGSRLNPDTIGTVADVAVSPAGDIYLLDGRTFVVHAFNPDGSPKYVFRPQGVDFPDHGTISLSRDGSLYLAGSSMGELIISPSGKASGFFGKARGEFDIDRYASLEAGGGLRWISQFGDSPLVLKDAGGKVAKVVTHRPDGGLLSAPTLLAVSPEGAVCVSNMAPSEGGMAPPDYPGHVSTFSPTGEPLATFEDPNDLWYSFVAFDGSRIFARMEKRVSCYSLQGEQLWKATLKEIPQGAWPVVTPDGSFLIVITPTKATYYPLPAR